jgi:adenylate kinase
VASEYSQRGILLSVDGMGNEDEVFDQLLAALRAAFPSAVPDSAP